MGIRELKVIKSVKVLTVVTSMLVLAGCGAVPQKQESYEPMPAVNDGTVQHSFDDESMVSSWLRAETARQNGDFMGAFKELRKALDIDSTDPVVWSRLAEIALRLDRPEPAEKYASRSNELADGNISLVYRNWLIIQRAREVSRDFVGAEMALKRANQYRP